MDTGKILELIEKVNGFLWGPAMLLLLLGTGVLLTFKLRFLQITKLKTACKQVFSKPENESGDVGMSPFQSLATSIASQVGTGNLAGVATAIVSGGPGAIFWLWISGFFGMGTIFSEAVLAQVFKKSEDGELRGGPAYYIKYGLNKPLLAAFFAISIVLALGFMGNMVQSNSISVAVNNAFPIPKIVIGVGVAILAGMILIGGTTRIGSFTEKVVPLMAGLYILGSIVIVALNFNQLIPTLKMIIVSAFTPQAAVGGFLGATIKDAMRYGIARGLFSNEAGMGSTPHAHAVAKVDHPVQQGLMSIFGVIVGTLICTLTALVILMTGVLNTGTTGAELTQQGFYVGFSRLGNFGGYFVAIALFFFAFSTIIGWYFFGEQNIKFLFGKKGIKYYRAIALIMVALGSVLDVELVWGLADTFNALMVIPNLIALIGLSGIVIKSVNEFGEKYEDKKASKKAILKKGLSTTIIK
ncbi:sodium:alanine symporter family protein [Proteiniborus sp.]|uniref:alanine/glycine:cation symporter family protein n=1 Tax=Proteiniborus sp. TaxID=2079015 RepID=UPI00331BB856